MLAFTIVLTLAASTSALVKTPYGLVHEDCVLQVPHGTTVTDTGSSVKVEHVNGTVVELSPCSAFPNAQPKRRSPPPASNGTGGLRRQLSEPATYQNFYDHDLFGYSSSPNYGGFNGLVDSFSATWNIPPAPVNPGPNTASPWSEDPTNLWWIGVQAEEGIAVIQPVLQFEYEGYSAMSWNCCPQGYTFYTAAIPAPPGSVVVGSITRIGTTGYVYDISTKVGTQTSSLRADLTGLAGWTPSLIEVMYESYDVSECSQLPTQPVTFNNIALTATAPSCFWFAPSWYGTGCKSTSQVINVNPAKIPWGSYFSSDTDYDISPSSIYCKGKLASDSKGDVTISFNN